MRNRQCLLDELGGTVILTAHTGVQKRADTSYAFAQDANFRCLTGIDAADWRLIIDSRRNKSILVAPDVDETHQIFDGALSFDDAKRISGVDEVLPASGFNDLLASLRRDYSEVYTLGEDPHAPHYSFVENPAQQRLRDELAEVFDEVKDCRSALAKLRAIKQPEEIETMRQSVALTVDAFSIAKSKLAELSTEYELEAEFGYAFRRANAVHAYDPIVAGGKNACTLHYVDNSQPLKTGEFVLIDIGAEVDGYAADITRTYAIGEVPERHKAVHAAVERAEREIITLLRPGLSVREYHERVDEIMIRELVNLGLMQHVDDTENYRKYFPHAISHGLGLDVHDSLGKPEVFESGMVLTVEPGIYIPEEGIGVRIEDDILITDDGHENLSQALPTSM